MAKQKKGSEQDNFSAVGELSFKGVFLNLQQTINYRPTFGKENRVSKGRVFSFKEMNEDSWWVRVLDNVTGDYDWVSLNVQLSYLTPAQITEVK